MGEANNNAAGARTAREVQQNFAESLGYAEEIIWDLLSQEQSEILIQKLKELIRDPQPPGRGSLEVEKKCIKIIADNERARQTIFNAVWEQRKYTNRQSLTAIIYVMVVAGVEDVTQAEDSKTFSCHPVFRARRCINSSSGNSSDSSDCCNIFVDENGRVYQNWAQYVATNELPAGVMVAPERGLYRLVRGQVRLDKYGTPAGSTNRKVLGYLDTGSAIGGIAAACIPIAGLFTLPVSVPVMAVAGVVGLASAGYATARCSVKLVDRGQHEQSISVADREARGHWLGVVAGAVGLGAAGATQAMTAATNAGAFAQLTVNGMNISSIVISGTGVANGVLDLILKMKDGDDIRAMDMVQLSASMVLFTHSVYNFKLASTIINETANRNVGGFRDSLSKRLRRAFDKAFRETVRLRGNTHDKLDIIRTVDEMPNDLCNMNLEGRGNAAGVFAMHLSSVMVGGVRFVLKNYGRIIFEHVINTGSFENLISSMADNLKPDVFDLVMKLTRTFMDTMLDELSSVLKFYISTESVLSRIFYQVMSKFRHMSREELDMYTGEIFTGVRRYFMSLNPNSFLGHLEKCQVCEGYFQITPL